MFPSIGSVGRRFAFLHRVLRGEFPCFNSTIKALRLPAAHPAALRFLRLEVPQRPLVVFALRRTSAPPKPGVGHPVTPPGILTEETTGPPKFLENPDCPFAMIQSDSGRTAHTRPVRCSSVAPGTTTARAPTKGLSELNSMAFGLAVYASQCASPRPTQDSLPARWSGATERAVHPQGSDERFQK